VIFIFSYFYFIGPYLRFEAFDQKNAKGIENHQHANGKIKVESRDSA
jgi:hypothetical protein